ncbi:hypothetical protein [Dyella japonica]|uniref:DNA-directed RNA polymerase subunit RPC12/RpoP n=1 Tax=Dyella japonica TaxID=231455 RepID=A0ABV2JZ66_9GAMM
MATMWTCIRCKTELTTKDALPSIDSFGGYVMCPVCGRRNGLRSISDRRDDVPVALEQVDEPE